MNTLPMAMEERLLGNYNSVNTFQAWVSVNKRQKEGSLPGYSAFKEELIYTKPTSNY